MKDFKKNFRGNRSGGGSRGGGRQGGFGGGNRGHRDFGAPQMHKTTCSSCGNMAEVPFKPNGDKPVLCSNCFGSSRDGGQNGSGRRNDGRGDRFNKEKSFNRPQSSDQSKDVKYLQDQVKTLHRKIDAVIKHLGITYQNEDVTKNTDTSFSKNIVTTEAVVKIPKYEKPKPEELTKAVSEALNKKPSKKKVAKKTTKKVAKKKTAKKVAKKVSKKKK